MLWHRTHALIMIYMFTFVFIFHTYLTYTGAIRTIKWKSDFACCQIRNGPWCWIANIYASMPAYNIKCYSYYLWHICAYECEYVVRRWTRSGDTGFVYDVYRWKMAQAPHKHTKVCAPRFMPIYASTLGRASTPLPARWLKQLCGNKPFKVPYFTCTNIAE